MRAHGHAMAKHLVTGVTPPDVLFLTELHLKARSASRQGELEQLGMGKAADQAQSRSAHDAWQTLTSSPELVGWTHLLSLHADHRGMSGVVAFLRPGLVPLSVRYTLDAAAPEGTHHPEGRVILLEFQTFLQPAADIFAEQRQDG
jgi:hypothetical protein